MNESAKVRGILHIYPPANRRRLDFVGCVSIRLVIDGEGDGEGG